MSYRGGRGRGRGRGGRGGGYYGGSSGGRGSQGPQSFDSSKPNTGGDNGGSHSDLVELLRRLDGKQYPAYHDIESSTRGWVNNIEGYTLYIGKAQGDPYAKPTRCRVIVKGDTAKFPPVSHQNKVRSVALGDYLNRVFYQSCKDMGANVKAREANWNGPKGGDIEVRFVHIHGKDVLIYTSVSVHCISWHKTECNDVYTYTYISSVSFLCLKDFDAYTTCD